MDDRCFYMCYVSGMGAPVRIHSNFDIANEEAKRLCRKEKRKVYILQAIKMIELNEFTETNLMEDLPV